MYMVIEQTQKKQHSKKNQSSTVQIQIYMHNKHPIYGTTKNEREREWGGGGGGDGVS